MISKQELLYIRQRGESMLLLPTISVGTYGRKEEAQGPGGPRVDTSSDKQICLCHNLRLGTHSIFHYVYVP